jgi:hypothetical protein
MIRDKGPILLIPAAWALTFLTMVMEFDPYWIRHMHYFMVLFLAGFTVLSWKEMDGPVLNIWRKIIASGIVFTGLGALSFSVQGYSQVLAGASLAYWFIAPGIGLILSGREMEEYSERYSQLGAASITSLPVFILGLFFRPEVFYTLTFVIAAASQTWSIVIAAELDSS